MMRLAGVTVTLAVCALAACSSDGSSEAAGGAGGSGGSGGSSSGGSGGMAGGSGVDGVPPELRSFRAELGGAVPASYDLTNQDRSHVLTDPAEVTFVVFASDDLTATEDLAVAVFAGDSELAATSSQFVSGLWRVTVAVPPGSRCTARVVDDAGNATSSETALVVPSFDEAIADSWEVRFYDEQQGVQHRWLLDWRSDGSWSETRQDNGLSLGGTFRFDGDTLAVSETTRSDGDADASTVEREQRGAFYVDGTYFARAPYLLKSGDGDITSVWERSYELYAPGAGGLELSEAVTETLELKDDDSYAWSRTGTGPGASSSTASGSYTVELNQNYTESVGDFLTLTATAVDGTPVSGQEPEINLYVIRAGRLLVQPQIRRP